VYFVAPHDQPYNPAGTLSQRSRDFSRPAPTGGVSNAFGLIYADHKLKEAVPVQTVAERRRLTVHNVRRGKGTEAGVPLFLFTKSLVGV
jgi:hypothetical protein